MKRSTLNVAGGFQFYKPIQEFMKNCENFYGDKLITDVYDSIWGLKWSGGRMLPQTGSLEEYIGMVKSYNNQGIGFRFAFNNVLLTQEHMSDKWCNYVLKECENPLNSVIIATDVLYDHVKTNYPKYKTEASMCFNKNSVKDLKWYQEATKKYDIVVLHADLNKEYDFIKQLDTSKLEVLVNERCMKNCKYREKHNIAISKANLEGNCLFSTAKDRPSCFNSKNHEGYNNMELCLTLEEMEQLEALGVSKFKIQGRQNIQGFQNYMSIYAEKKYIKDLKRGNE